MMKKHHALYKIKNAVAIALQNHLKLNWAHCQQPSKATNMKLFDVFFEKFKQTSLWVSMENTVEDSHWHREKNTAVHTQMMLDWYDANVKDSRSERLQLLTKLAILFHDVGKPVVEEVKENASRGTYRSYADHESRSSREFENFMMKDDQLYRKALGLTMQDMYTVMYMIAYHLPYKYVKAIKRVGLKATLQYFLGDKYFAFFDLLRADQHGRISDNGDVEKQEVELWISEFEKLEVPTSDYLDSEKQLIVLIGASRTDGKSTYCQQLTDTTVVSLDTDRVEFYLKNNSSSSVTSIGDLYAKAWTYCNENSAEFDRYHATKYHEVFKSDSINYVAIDNTNVSTKSRAKYINAARKFGYYVKAVMFPCDVETHIARQKTRSDKSVPTAAVVRQYYSIALPLILYEVDDIRFISDSK
jgi:predicted kinase